jgi:hypothetical protein
MVKEHIKIIFISDSEVCCEGLRYVLLKVRAKRNLQLRKTIVVDLLLTMSVLIK